jgi:hypothetical protein
VLSSAAGLLAAGCAGNPVFRTIESAAARATGMPRDVKIDRATIAKIPYATIQARFGGGPSALLVLNAYDGETLEWIDTDNNLLATRAGRLVKTVGFREDLRRVVLEGTDPLADAPQHLAGPARFSMRYDLMASTLDVVQLASRVEPMGEETITIAEIDFKTTRLRERCNAVSTKWAFNNDYWVDIYDGFVWRSRQHFAKSLPPLTIEVLKPAA